MSEEELQKEYEEIRNIYWSRPDHGMVPMTQREDE